MGSVMGPQPRQERHMGWEIPVGRQLAASLEVEEALGALRCIQQMDQQQQQQVEEVADWEYLEVVHTSQALAVVEGEPGADRTYPLKVAEGEP